MTGGAPTKTLDNPGSSTNNYITNGEFPYAVQDSAIANKNVQAWTLDSILLPSEANYKSYPRKR